MGPTGKHCRGRHRIRPGGSGGDPHSHPGDAAIVSRRAVRRRPGRSPPRTVGDGAASERSSAGSRVSVLLLAALEGRATSIADRRARELPQHRLRVPDARSERVMAPSADSPPPVRLCGGALGLGESALGPADPPPLRLRVRLLGDARRPLGGLRQPAAEDRWRHGRGARVGGQRLRDQASRTLLLRDALVLAAQRRGARVLGEPIAVVALLVAGAGSAFRVRRRVRTRAVGQHAGIDRALVPVVALGTADAPAVLAMTVDSAGIVGGAGRARLRHVARDAAGPRAAWVAAGQVDALSADAVPALFGAVAGFCILTVLVLLTATRLRRVLAAYLRVAGLRRAGRAIVARYRLVHAATPALARVDRAGVSVVTRDAVTHDEAVLATVVHRAIVPVIALYRTAAAALGLRGPRAAVHAVRRFASAAEAGLDDTAGRAAVAC